MIDRLRAWWEWRRCVHWCKQQGLFATRPPIAALSEEEAAKHAAFCVEMYDLYGRKR